MGGSSGTQEAAVSSKILPENALFSSNLDRIDTDPTVVNVNLESSESIDESILKQLHEGGIEGQQANNADELSETEATIRDQ